MVVFQITTANGDPFDNSASPVGYFNGYQRIIEAAMVFRVKITKSEIKFWNT